MKELIGKTEKEARQILGDQCAINVQYLTNNRQDQADTMIVVRALARDSEIELTLTPFIMKV